MQDAGSTAAQLLAFYAEPVRYRQRLTHGRVPFPGGAHVFRFAGGKFPPAILKKLPEQERARLREAAVFFVHQVCFWEGASHYQVLCVAPDARSQAIREHYQALMALIHPDRRAEGEEAWPEAFAQRANEAWAVLSDPASRRHYDAQSPRTGVPVDHGSPAGAPGRFEDRTPGHDEMPLAGSAGRRRGHAGRVRYRSTATIASLALAGMFFAYAWWASQVPSEFATLQGATPFERSLQWMRDVGTGTKLPGFLGATPAQAESGKDATAVAPPIVRASFSTTAPSEPVRESPVPPARPPIATVEVQEVGAPLVKEPPGQVIAEPVIRRASADPPMPPAPTSRVRSATSELAARLPDLEILVTRMVTYYEEGNLDLLLGLYDADGLGVMEAYRIRSDFGDFFRSTEARRLRIRELNWSASEGTARGRGKATVVADYGDRRERLERAVDLEIDVVTIGGKSRIARLSLFPHEPR